jgi:predicted DNA-binding protein (UPF0251 family)
MSELTEIHLTMDEMEALRLADVEGYEHAEAAPLMGISRQTFGRILKDAHAKMARAVVEGCAIHIEGGVYNMYDEVELECESCGKSWRPSQSAIAHPACPRCNGRKIKIFSLEAE